MSLWICFIFLGAAAWPATCITFSSFISHSAPNIMCGGVYTPKTHSKNSEHDGFVHAFAFLLVEWNFDLQFSNKRRPGFCPWLFCIKCPAENGEALILTRSTQKFVQLKQDASGRQNAFLRTTSDQQTKNTKHLKSLCYMSSRKLVKTQVLWRKYVPEKLTDIGKKHVYIETTCFPEYQRSLHVLRRIGLKTNIQQTTSFELLINCLHTYNGDRRKHETYTVYKGSVYIYIYSKYVHVKTHIMTTLPHILHNQSVNQSISQSINQSIKQAIKYSNQLHNIKQLVVSRYPNQTKNYHMKKFPWSKKTWLWRRNFRNARYRPRILPCYRIDIQPRCNYDTPEVAVVLKSVFDPTLG